MASLRQPKFEAEQLETLIKQTPKVLPYQDYEDIFTLDELRYFGQLTALCSSTSFFSFLFLALEWTPLLAISLALALSLGTVRLGKWLIGYIQVAIRQ